MMHLFVVNHPVRIFHIYLCDGMALASWIVDVVSLKAKFNNMAEAVKHPKAENPNETSSHKGKGQVRSQDGSAQRITCNEIAYH